MRILHLADIHLGASFAAFGALAGRRAEALVDSFQRLPEIVEAEAAQAVLVAGDLFDSPHPPPELREAVREVFSDLRELDVPALISPGHYDPAWIPGSVYRDDLAAHALGDPGFGTPYHVETEAGSLYVYGAGYDPARVTDPLDTYRRRDAAGAHVVVLHCALPDSSHWKAGRYSLDLTTKALRKVEADYLALGGDHRFRGPDDLDGLAACFPGSFAAVDPAETGLRGAVVVDLSPGAPPEIRRVPGGLPRVEDVGAIDVAGMADEAAIVDALLEAAGTEALPRARLVGTPGFPLDAALIERLVARSAGFAEVIDETRYADAEHLDELTERDSILGHAVRLGRERVRASETPGDRRTAEEALRIATRALTGAS